MKFLAIVDQGMLIKLLSAIRKAIFDKFGERKLKDGFFFNEGGNLLIFMQIPKRFEGKTLKKLFLMLREGIFIKETR